MSRHTRQECTLPLFQIEIRDFSKKNGNNHNGLAGVLYGTTYQVNGNTYRRKEIVKVDDISGCESRRTLCKRFKNDTAALRWAKRIGSVLSCKKVDVSRYLNNIEYRKDLLGGGNTIEVVIDKQEFVLEKDFVITRSGLTVGEIEA